MDEPVRKKKRSIPARPCLAWRLTGWILKIHPDRRAHRNKQPTGVLVCVFMRRNKIHSAIFPTRTAGRAQILALHLVGGHLAAIAVLFFPAAAAANTDERRPPRLGGALAGPVTSRRFYSFPRLFVHRFRAGCHFVGVLAASEAGGSRPAAPAALPSLPSCQRCLFCHHTWKTFTFCLIFHLQINITASKSMQNL